MTLRTVLLSLQALLAAAEPDDPQDAVVANQVRLCICFIFHSRQASKYCKVVATAFILTLKLSTNRQIT